MKNIIKKNKKEAIFLAILLCIILFLPLFVSHISVRMWSELKWQDFSDISMLEWTGAFLHVFLFLLLLEYFRQTAKLSFAILGGGFFCMGLQNFAYALLKPGSEIAEWIKCLCFISGSLAFLLSVVFWEKKENDLVRVIFKFILPLLFLAALDIWIPLKIRLILPEFLAQDENAYSLTGKLLLWFAGALFFISGISWLRKYISKGGNENLVFTILIFVFAQVCLMARFGQIWGVLWWIWHIMLVIAVFLVSLYLLSVCLRRSLIWRLLLSLAFVFGLTIVMTSGVMHGIYEKKTLEEFRNTISLRQRCLIAEESKNIDLTVRTLHALRKKVEKMPIFPETGPENSELLKYKILGILAEEQSSGGNYSIETGFFSYDGSLIFSSLNRVNSVKIDILKKVGEQIRKRNKENSGIIWGDFFFLEEFKAWSAPAVLPINIQSLNGFFYQAPNLSALRNKSITENRNMDGFEGRIIINRNTAKPVFSFLPPSYLLLFDGKISGENLPLTKIICQEAFLSHDNKDSFSVSSRGKNFHVFTGALPQTPWIVADVIDYDFLSGNHDDKTRYLHAATGMVSLLLGFVILLLLLNYQLAKPLGRILSATKKLESGDFSVHIDFNLKNELGTLADSFNHMVEKLRSLYKNLEEAVSDKAKALDEMRKSSAARIAFFTKISHELRTPLHGILSFSRFGMNLECSKDNRKMHDYFKSINYSGERLMKIINELLDFAKIKSGHMDFSFSESSLYIVVIQIYEELKAAFEEKNIKFICDKPVFSEKAFFDREKIARVVRNIMGNALNFSEPGKKVVVEFLKENDTVSVRFFDEGPGIPKNDLENIFEEFFQSEKLNKNEGTGLGLAICREIIKSHNGTICAQNGENGGAVITFTIPVKQTTDSKLGVDEE